MHLHSKQSKKEPIQFDLAWDGDTFPGEISFKHSVPVTIAHAITINLFEIIKVGNKANVKLNSLKPVSDCAGHYKFEIQNETWFIRITRRIRKNVVLENIISYYLSNQGLDINLPLIANSELIYSNQLYSLSVYPYIEGRHFNGTENDLKNLTKTLVDVHSAFRGFKYANLIKQNALETAKRIEAIKNEVHKAINKRKYSIFYEHQGWAEKNSSWLLELVENYDPYICNWPGSQLVHGELHIGNVIFEKGSGNVILIDFEESPDSWFPPLYDLAFLAHRFCINEVGSKETFNKRLKVVENIYGKISSDLKIMMRHICWYKIMLILDGRLSNQYITTEKEYNKFADLDDVTNKVFS